MNRYLFFCLPLALTLVPLCSFVPNPAPLEHRTLPLSLNTEVIEIPEFAVGEARVVKGDLAQGKVLEQLDWAANSSVACFPATRFVEFEGKQVFYSLTIPKGSELTVRLASTGRKQRINLYGYLNFDGSNLPPISRCISCEASYPLYAGTPNLRQVGDPRSMVFGQAINRSYTVLIAVAGARGVTEGSYDLSLSLKAR